jgi:hypothetical protein
MEINFYNQWKEFKKDRLIKIFDIFAVIFVREGTTNIISLSILGFVLSIDFGGD